MLTERQSDDRPLSVVELDQRNLFCREPLPAMQTLTAAVGWQAGRGQ